MGLEQAGAQDQERSAGKGTPGKLVAVEVLLALLAGLALRALGLGPTAWVVGGVLCGAVVFRVLTRYRGDLSPNRSVRYTGMALVGLALGLSVSFNEFARLSEVLLLLVLLTLFMILSGILVGWLYSGLSNTDPVSAMMATLPGGVGVMAGAAADAGRNVSLVALVQAARVSAVVVLVTLIASTWYGTSGGPEESSLAEELATTLEVARAGLLLVALGLTYVGVRIAAAARVPVAPLLGAMFVGAAYAQLLTFAPGVVEFQPPELLDAVGQALLGITIGEYLGCRLALEARAVIYGMASVAATVLIGVVLASVLALWTSWSWLTCLLLTAPGGAPEMIVLALALDQEVELITAGHIIRQLAINGLLPFCLLLFRRIEARNR